MVTPINITGDVALSSEMKTYYSKQMIENFYGKVVYNLFGEPGIIPKNGGKTIEWRRLAKLSVDKTPLTEGVTPAGENLSVSTVTATATQNGKPIYYSDVLETTTIDPLIDKAATELIPGNAAETLESKSADVVCAGTNVFYAGSNVARATVQDTDVITSVLVRKAVRNLKKKNVPTFEGGFYIAICAPDTTFDLQSDADWKDPHKYVDRVGKMGGIYPMEIGLFAGVRFMESSFSKRFAHQGAGTDALHTTLDGGAAAGQAVIPLTSTTGLAAGDVCTIRNLSGYFEEEITIDSVDAGVSITATTDLVHTYVATDKFDKGDDVYGTLIFGRGFYGVAEIDGLRGPKRIGNVAFEVILKSIGSSGSEDPLDQRGSIGWKCMNKTVILDNDRGIRVEHGVTDGVSA